MQSLKNQEDERLWHSLSDSIPSVDPNLANPFVCRFCQQTAVTPVISTCGHICCWKCVQREAEGRNGLLCPGCDEVFLVEDLRPLYISGQDHDHVHLVARPKGRNPEPIRNPGGFMAQQTQVQHMQNNIEIGKQVPSVMGLPSNFILALSDLSPNAEEMENTDQKNVSWIIRKIRTCLLVSLGLVILGVLLVFDAK